PNGKCLLRAPADDRISSPLPFGDLPFGRLKNLFSPDWPQACLAGGSRRRPHGAAPETEPRVKDRVVRSLSGELAWGSRGPPEDGKSIMADEGATKTFDQKIKDLGDQL